MTNFVWTVLNLDPAISDSTIFGWLQAAEIPACFSFVFTSPFANAWSTIDAYGGTAPMPIAPWTIAVSSFSDQRFKWTVLGLSTVGFHQASVAYVGNESAAEMGARMWHEILHSYSIPADSMQTSERAAFTDYLRTTGSPHYSGFATDPLSYENGANHTQLLIAYYMYLMKKYMSCECFREGCGQQPVVPLGSGSQGEEELSTSDNTDNSALWIIGAVVALVMLI